VGRKSSCPLVLSCKSVSSVHAELIDRGTTLLLRDLQSTNGTYVNGQRISGEVEVQPGDLIQFARSPFRVLRQDVMLNCVTAAEDVCSQAMALVLFDRLMSERAVIPHYQPMVDVRSSQIHAWEVLGRSHVPGLEMPSRMFTAASQLSLEVPLSQMIRVKAVEETRDCAQPPHLFLNTHPHELQSDGLIESLRMLRDVQPRQPLTLEIHEAAISDVGEMVRLHAELKELNVTLAFDDFGAGQSRLLELADVRPEYLKFDMSMIRALDGADRDRYRMVESLVSMVQRMEIAAVAEGVETEAELTACKEIGFQYVQGYYYGRPSPLRAGAAGAPFDTIDAPQRLDRLA
jgi:EAL domain-containing protein (putative c-di-GMP-specific phosphodiesterase class I)